MLVRFHLSTGAILDKNVPNMNDIGHVANTLNKFGKVYIDDFNGVILKEHVVYMEQLEEVTPLTEDLNRFEKLSIEGYDSKAEQEVNEYIRDTIYVPPIHYNPGGE